ncbi:MAG: prepilin peptidase [Bacilli bacterium]|nr:prepilin peptidase [Bacilli bacterium]
MMMYYYVMFFIVGTIFGSYFNLVATRIPMGKSTVTPRSHCENCNHQLKWYELIPILSFIIQKGKCRNCHAELSVNYLLTELFTGILFVVSFYSFKFSYDLIIALTLSSTLILIIVSDLNYLIIPDRFIIIPSIIIFIVTIVSRGIQNALIQVGYGVISFAIMYLVMLLGNFLFKKESLGGADIKLMFLVGLTLNPMLSIIVIFLASFIALPISLILLVKNKEHVIPYGPFLMIGFLIVFFMKMEVSEIFEMVLHLF